MTTPAQIQVEFPKSQRDLFPPAAQQLYVEAYKQSYAESLKGDSGQLSHEGVASRDAWFAVKKAFVEDHLTHKWRAIGESEAAAPAPNPSLLERFKRLFKR
jgi:cation transport regulator ChaB